MKKILSLFLAVAALTAVTAPAGAASEPDETPYVADEAHVLTSALEQAIMDANTDLVGNCSGASITVVTVPNAPDGKDHQSYAKELFDSWGIANSGQNIGMLLVMYTEDDSFHLELGAGLQGSGKTEDIALLTADNSDFCKYIRQDMDAEAVDWLLGQLVAWYYQNYHSGFLSAGGEYTAAAPGQNTGGYTPPQRKGGITLFKLVVFLLAAVVLLSPVFIYLRYRRWGIWPFVMFSRWWATRPGRNGSGLLSRLRRGRGIKARTDPRRASAPPPAGYPGGYNAQPGSYNGQPGGPGYPGGYGGTYPGGYGTPGSVPPQRPSAAAGTRPGSAGSRSTSRSYSGGRTGRGGRR